MPLLSHRLLVLLACLLLSSCVNQSAMEPATLTGRLVLPHSSPDWSGFVVQWLHDGEPVGETRKADADGRFRMSVPDLSAGQWQLQGSRGRTVLLLNMQPLPEAVELSPFSTVQAVSEGAEPALRDELLLIADAQLRTTLNQNVSDAMLERYRDTLALLQHAAQQPEHRRFIRLRYHDALAASEEVLNRPGFADALNPELTLMLRLDEQGEPLRWQHLSYTEQPWACVDFFEKGKRWPTVAARWPLGVRLWGVSPDYRRTTAEQTDALLAAANQSQRCGYSGWRLPTIDEVRTLTQPKSGAPEFPRSLPFTRLETLWVQDAEGKALVYHWQEQREVPADSATLLPFSFTADPRPPMKDAVAEPLDINALRQQYARPRSEWPAPSVDAGVNWQELGRLPAVEFPAENPYSEAKVALGQALFFDTNLSQQRNISCASCHIADQQWSDARRVSPGTNNETGKRNAMPVTNMAYSPNFFWDGRVRTLEEQSVHPVQDQLEMALTLDELQQRLEENPEYPALFNAAFGSGRITIEGFKQAVATFERTLISRPSAFDRFVGGDAQALTDAQLQGLHLYRTKARCMNCHSGPLLTDFTFRNTGLTYYGRELEDSAVFARSFRSSDMGVFRVPALRDIAFSAPYMHNGVFPILIRQGANGGVGGVIPMYNAGMTKGRNANYPQYQYKYDPFFPVVDDLIQPLGMTAEEMLALGEFLQAVSAPARSEPAPLPVLLNPASEIH